MSQSDFEKQNLDTSLRAETVVQDAALEQASSTPTVARFGVVAALCLVAIVAYIQRNSIGVAEQSISRDLGLTKQQMGWVMSAFFWSYAIFQIPTSLIGQRFGTRRTLSVFVAMFSAVAGLFTVAAGLPMMLLSRIGMGIGQAGTFPCAVQSISKWIPESWRSISAGMLGSCMSIGGALGAALTGILLPLIGWRVTFGLFCIPGLFFAIWFYWWFRDHPEEYVAKRVPDRMPAPASPVIPQEYVETQALKRQHNEVTSWKVFHAYRSIAALCCQQICRAAGYMFFGSWFATYLRETRGVSDMEVGMLNSLPLLAVVIGAPIGGILADLIFQRTGSRRLSRQGVGSVAMVGCGSMILLSYPIADPLFAVLAISAGSFFASFAGPCGYTATIDMGGRYTPVVFGTMNMMGNFGAALFPTIVPWLLNEGQTPGSGNWDLVLFVFAGLYFAAAVFWLLADTESSVDFQSASREST